MQEENTNAHAITETSKDKHDSLVAAMANFAESREPQIGIFWLDTDECDLFGVCKTDAAKVRPDRMGRRIYGKLHADIWRKEHFKELAQSGVAERYVGDYTMIPLGRVNQEGEEFVVYVGSWIDELAPMLTPLINCYFNIESFRYEKDIHWELGHGFSGDKFK